MQLALHGGCGWAYGRHDDRLAGDELHIHAPARVFLQRVELPCLDTGMDDTSTESSGHGLMLAGEGAARARLLRTCRQCNRAPGMGRSGARPRTVCHWLG